LSGGAADHSPPSNAQVENGGATSTPPYAFITFCLINYIYVDSNIVTPDLIETDTALLTILSNFMLAQYALNSPFFFSVGSHMK
jgi:hypothetical protein